MRFERHSIATGPPRTQMTSTLSTTYTERTHCSSTRNRASASEAGTTSRPLAPRSRTRKRFTVRRIVGTGDLWVTEFILAYDGQPSYSVSVMEFLDGKVARETQYFGDPFEPGPSRAHLVERMG